MRNSSLRRILSASFLISLIIFSSQVFAGDPNGTWSSSTGATVKLWANMQTVSVTVSTNQGSWKYNGWWTRFSDYFNYDVPGSGIRTCSFDRNNSNIIYVKSPDGSLTTWKRGASSNNNGYGYSTTAPYPSQQPYQQTPKQSVSLDGLWQSNSGNAYSIETRGSQIFFTLIMNNGARSQGIGRWLTYGSKFDFSLSAYPGTCVGYIQDYNTINVFYKGNKSIWTRR